MVLKEKVDDIKLLSQFCFLKEISIYFNVNKFKTRNRFLNTFSQIQILNDIINILQNVG